MRYDLVNYYDDATLINLTGQGIALNNLYDNMRAGTRYNYGLERINQSIQLILETRVGESLSNPLFGSRLHEVIFDGNTVLLHELVDMYIREALSLWETRIDVLNVQIINTITKSYDSYSETLAVPVIIEYRLKKTDIYGNYSMNLPVLAA